MVQVHARTSRRKCCRLKQRAVRAGHPFVCSVPILSWCMQDTLTTMTVVAWDLQLFALALIMFAVIEQRNGAEERKNSGSGRTAAALRMLLLAITAACLLGLLAATTALLSPLLASLTQSTSSDSIVSSSCVLILLHLYLHDYSRDGAYRGPIVHAGGARSISASLSLACAACSSVLIASRMPSRAHAFTQVHWPSHSTTQSHSCCWLVPAMACPAMPPSTVSCVLQVFVSLKLFILAPYVWRAVAKRSAMGEAVLAALMTGLAVLLIISQSVLMTSAFLCSIVFVVAICPRWLMRIQKFKAQINGPWDEAVPRLHRLVMNPG